jgi:AraC-like DNA-binding protein
MTLKQPDPGGAPELRTGFIELSVAHLPPAERLDFWYQTTGRRMECKYAAPDERPVRAHLQALVQADTEFMEYRSDAFVMRRDKRMCRHDDRDEISIGLVMSPRSGAVQDGTELPLQHGDLYVVDFGRPVDSMTLAHHELAVMLPRKLVARALGGATDALGGQKLSKRGIGGLLAAHMHALAREARFLSPSEQRIALQAAADLALATLQGTNPDMPPDMEQFSAGPYAAACRIIGHHCIEHTFNAEKLAVLLGCSRACLYRMFAGRELSVAGTIWKARLKHATRLLQSSRYHNLSISDIALRCGFLDPSAFSKMFKAQYGLSPREARYASRAE